MGCVKSTRNDRLNIIDQVTGGREQYHGELDPTKLDKTNKFEKIQRPEGAGLEGDKLPEMHELREMTEEQGFVD